MIKLRAYWPHLRSLLPLGILTALALILRLLVLSAHASYPLGGDEAGFFEQARAFVQGRGYQDVELMRGPLYPLFLAVIFRLWGAEVSAARLVQALLSAATVPLLYLWAGRRYGPRAGLAAAALGALFFPLAVQATTLLTETLFILLYVLGMVALEWTWERPAWWLALGTGMILGLATLTRSVGLPLIALAALAMVWAGARHSHRGKYLDNARLAFSSPASPPAASPPPPPLPALRGGEGVGGRGGADQKPNLTLSSYDRAKAEGDAPGKVAGRGGKMPRPYVAALLLLLGAALVILPWTARNAVVYRSFILVDTTGSTNLWLDNDPELGRDRVKAELLKYPEGERSALAARNGLNAIAAHPGWFLEKCWREIRLFFSLEYFDDFLARPAIWYPDAEVWARVLLGDGLYLLLVAAGLVGLVCRPGPVFAAILDARGVQVRAGQPDEEGTGPRWLWLAFGKGSMRGAGGRRPPSTGEAGDQGPPPKAAIGLFELLWLAYLLFTAALFHVELRYRLPFLVALVPYAAVVLAHPRVTWAGLRRSWPRLALAAVALLAFAGLLLAHADYPRLAYRIAVKRVRLSLGEGALARGNLPGAENHARAALDVYGESSAARVLLAQALWRAGRADEAAAALREAIAYRSGHPHPHLLLGDLLRAQGRIEEARPELAYERNSLEDLQGWLGERVMTPVPTALDLGTGLELGFVRGWHLPETAGDGATFRWTDDRVTFRLAVPGSPAGTPGSAPLRLSLRLAAGRPEGEPLPQVELWLEGRRLASFTAANGWHTYTLDIPAITPGSVLEFELRSTTWRPHAHDPHLDDNRALGVMGDWVVVIGDW